MGPPIGRRALHATHDALLASLPDVQTQGLSLQCVLGARLAKPPGSCPPRRTLTVRGIQDMVREREEEAAMSPAAPCLPGLPAPMPTSLLADALLPILPLRRPWLTSTRRAAATCGCARAALWPAAAAALRFACCGQARPATLLGLATSQSFHVFSFAVLCRAALPRMVLSLSGSSPR